MATLPFDTVLMRRQFRFRTGDLPQIHPEVLGVPKAGAALHNPSSHSPDDGNQPDSALKRDIGVVGALSIGIGGIVGGGFFATFGIAVIGARGSTYLSFLLGGLLALLTAYSYVRLTLRYPGPAGTAGFVRLAFGRSLVPASVNVLLIYCYIAIMAVYAHALAAYAASYLPAGERTFWVHLLSSAAIILLGVINYAGADVMAKFEDVFNIGKLGILGVFIVAGFFLGSPDWARLGVSDWVPTTRIISSGIIVFLAYEGFELISNASGRIKDPARTLPIAFYGSVLAAIFIYVLAIAVAIANMPFEAMKEAESFALSAVAQQFMGSFGFGLLTLGAVLASASAINADFFGGAKLPIMLAKHGEMPRPFSDGVAGKHLLSMLFVGGVALIAVNFVDLSALSAATSAGFLIVYAAVNFANMKLAGETGSRGWIAAIAAAVCIIALGVTLYDFAIDPDTRMSAVAMLGIVALSIVSERGFRACWPVESADAIRVAAAHDIGERSRTSLRQKRRLVESALILGVLAAAGALIWHSQNRITSGSNPSEELTEVSSETTSSTAPSALAENSPPTPAMAPDSEMMKSPSSMPGAKAPSGLAEPGAALPKRQPPKAPLPRKQAKRKHGR